MNRQTYSFIYICVIVCFVFIAQFLESLRWRTSVFWLQECWTRMEKGGAGKKGATCCILAAFASACCAVRLLPFLVHVYMGRMGLLHHSNYSVHFHTWTANSRY